MMYTPDQADGQNATLDSAISASGDATVGTIYRVPPRCGMAVRVAAGQSIRVVNTHGTQVCDFWAFSAENLYEFLSMAHCHTELESVMPAIGDTLVSNRRRPIVSITHDDSPGVHDTVIACCDWPRYQRLGCVDYHDNCADNLRMALAAINLKAPHVPDPFNLWMNIPIAASGTIAWLPPQASAGNSVVMRAEMDLIAVMSACPQDVTPVNGRDCIPSELHFRVEA
jgi:uncharacterized protein YcgI (DUF1989 family)